MLRFAFALLLIYAPALAVAQSASELAFAKRLLASLQEPSFAAGREYCGTIGMTDSGQLIASRPRKGRATSCRPRDARRADVIIASYHTHGRYNFDIYSEIPSPDDVYTDMEDGVDGWLSTPGGRLWFIDGRTGVSRQICGRGCLPMDPDFEPGFMGQIPIRFTLDALERFFAN